MATIVDLCARRSAKSEGIARFVSCSQCGERHPVVRLADGTQRYPTAFADDEHWFCLNRGCRAAWIERHTEQR